MKKKKESSLELIHFLKQVNLFSDLSHYDLRKFIGSFNVYSYKANEVLFQQGDDGDKIYIVKSGKIVITIKTNDGADRVVAELGKGDFFGEMSIFDKAPRSATCKAKEGSVLLTLYDTDFFNVIKTNPDIAIKIMYKMLNITTLRLNDASRFLSDMVQWGEDARKRAITDPLTGVYNKRYLDDQVDDKFDAAKKENKPLSIVMSDLDHFRRINEGFSMEMGDRAIIEVAKIFKKVCREKDIIARLGGDEYTLVLPDTDKATAMRLCEEACAEVRKIDILKDLNGPLKQFTLSLGVSTFPDDAQDVNTLKQKADKALYVAKESGRDRVVGSTSE